MIKEEKLKAGKRHALQLKATWVVSEAQKHEEY
jgi:hypothetical protein